MAASRSEPYCDSTERAVKTVSLAGQDDNCAAETSAFFQALDCGFRYHAVKEGVNFVRVHHSQNASMSFWSDRYHLQKIEVAANEPVQFFSVQPLTHLPPSLRRNVHAFQYELILAGED